MRNRNLKFVLRLAGLVLLAIVWYIFSILNAFDESLLAKPIEVFNTLSNSFKDGVGRSEQVHRHALSTVILAFKGWGISMVLGVFIGLLLGQNDKVLNLIEPIIDFFRSIPPILAFPLFLVAYNYENQAYVWTIVFGCLPIIIISIADGVSRISKEPFEILNSLRVRKVIQQAFYGVEMMPSIILSARLSFSFSIIIAIVCEMVFTPRNGWALGALAKDSEMSFDTPLFYSCIIIIGIYGYIINRFFITLEEKF